MLDFFKSLHLKIHSIRYAAPPTGSNRWQAPKAPEVNRASSLPANALPPNCPQAFDSPDPLGYNFTGNEDCLYLSIYAPQNATNLPVLVWIRTLGWRLEGISNLLIACMQMVVAMVRAKAVKISPPSSIQTTMASLASLSSIGYVDDQSSDGFRGS